MQPPSFKGLANRVWVRPVARECVEDGGLQLGGAVVFEQAEQAIDDGAALCGACQQGLAGWRRLCQLIGRAMLMRRVFFVDESPYMSGIFDLCAFVIAARMASQHFGAGCEPKLYDSLSGGIL